jgi:putative ABC transport system permease protein
VYGATVSANLFTILRVSPLRGRLFRPGEDRWGGGDGTHPVLISGRLWHSRFEGDADILGKPMVLDAKEFRIIGVISARFAYPIQNDQADYWITVATDADPSYYNGSIPTSRGYPRYDAALARLKPAATIEQARAEMNLIAENIAREHPKASSMDEVRITPATEDLVAPARPMLLLLYGGVFCILLVACANAATLLLVGATAREKEFAVRAALGAKSRRLIRQLLIESLVISVSGGIVGVVLALSLVALFARLAPPDTPRLFNLQVDPTVLLYALLVSAATGLFFGLIPAVAATRIDLVCRLKETSRSLGGRYRILRPGTLLIGGQIALSMALTCSAAVLGSSFLKILQSPKGFEPRHILTASVSLPVSGYPRQSKKVAQFYEALLQNVRALPGVVSRAPPKPFRSVDRITAQRSKLWVARNRDSRRLICASSSRSTSKRSGFPLSRADSSTSAIRQTARHVSSSTKRSSGGS